MTDSSIGLGQSFDSIDCDGSVFARYNSNFLTIPGVYIFPLEDGRYFYPLYVGQSENVVKRIEELKGDPQIWKFIKKFAKETLIYECENRRTREKLERKLIEGFNPPLNVDHRTDICDSIFKRKKIPDLFSIKNN